MNSAPLWAVEHKQGPETLLAIEPTAAELRQAAPALAAFYNDDHNRRMMGHRAEPLTADDVVAVYEDLRAQEGRPFLLYRDGALMGDADFRNPDGDTGEFAIMIGGRAEQGRGLGTRFGRMLHVFGFRRLGLARIYISVIPANTASRRLFQKLGYQVDQSAEAREFADEETDIVMSLAHDTFDRAPGVDLTGIRVFQRPAS
ncbi:MAG TPA: GNAT family N-acetyltransferase [Polyangia bacterium]|nr:GNAT family N-acetyltransferase [Polyangia bacterium]